MTEYINFSSICRIGADQILAVFSVNENIIAEIKRNKKNTCIDLTNNGEIKTAVIAKDGFVYFFPVKFDAVFSKIEKYQSTILTDLEQTN